MARGSLKSLFRRVGASWSHVQRGRRGAVLGSAFQLLIRVTIALLISFIGALWFDHQVDHDVTLNFDELTIRLSKQHRAALEPDLVADGVRAIDLEMPVVFAGATNLGQGPDAGVSWTGSLVPAPGSEILPLDNLLLRTECDAVEVGVRAGQSPVLALRPAHGCVHPLTGTAILRGDVAFIGTSTDRNDGSVQHVRTSFDGGVIAVSKAPWGMPLDRVRVAGRAVVLDGPPAPTENASSAEKVAASAGASSPTLASIDSISGTLSDAVEVPSGLGMCRLEGSHRVTLNRTNWAFQSVRFDEHARHLAVTAGNPAGVVEGDCEEANGKPCSPPVCQRLRRSIVDKMLGFFIPAAISLIAMAIATARKASCKDKDS